MKIESISGSPSHKDEVVILTCPQLRATVFDRFRLLFEKDAALEAFGTKFWDGALILYSQAFGVPPSPSDEQAARILRLLNAAEQEEERAAELRRDKVERERADKQKAAAAVAKAFGVPVK